MPGGNWVALTADPLAASLFGSSGAGWGYDISGYAINNGASQVVQAAYNWWGAATGPTAPDNPGGTGSALTGLVLYRPWLTKPGIQFIFLPLTIKLSGR